MDAVTTATLNDLLRRLRLAGDQHSDLRCFLAHGLKLRLGDLRQHFGGMFSYCRFRPLGQDGDWWETAFYRKNVRAAYPMLAPVANDAEYRKKSNELNESARAISVKLKALFSDALWFAESIGLSRLPGCENVRRLSRDELAWMWLLFHSAWTCPAGSTLRADKEYPAVMTARMEFNQRRDDAQENGTWDGTKAEQLRVEIAERHCMESFDRLENGEFISHLAGDPFTASAQLLELMACSPATPVNDPDSAKRRSPSLPDNPDVRDLCHLLNKNRDALNSKTKTEIGIAREFTGESAHRDRKAKNLLRQARRFPHLWKQLP